MQRLRQQITAFRGIGVDEHGELGSVLVPASCAVSMANDGGNRDAKTPSRRKRVGSHRLEGGAGSGGSRPPTKPPRGGNGPTAGGEKPEDRLTRLFAAQTASATGEQRASVVRWQGKDRFYEKVQQAATEVGGDSAATKVANDLDQLALPLSEDVEVWRGIRNTVHAFGVAAESITDLVGRDWVEDRFTSTTTNPDMAVSQFTDPGVGPALLRVTAKAGADAVWLPPLGGRESAGQNELLFTPGANMRIVGVDNSGDIPVIEMEVS